MVYLWQFRCNPSQRRCLHRAWIICVDKQIVMAGPYTKDARLAQNSAPILCCAQWGGWACQPVPHKLVKPGFCPHVFCSLGPSLTSQSRCFLICPAWKPNLCVCSSNLVTNIRETSGRQVNCRGGRMQCCGCMTRSEMHHQPGHQHPAHSLQLSL